MKVHYTIPLAPVTKKNSQRVLIRQNGKPFVAPSEQYKRYESQAGWFLRPAPPKPIESRIHIKALFYMPDNRIVDRPNLEQALYDILVKYRIIKDDNSRIVASGDGTRVYVDREQPRTEIYIEEYEGEQQ